MSKETSADGRLAELYERMQEAETADERVALAREFGALDRERHREVYDRLERE